MTIYNLIIYLPYKVLSLQLKETNIPPAWMHTETKRIPRSQIQNPPTHPLDPLFERPLWIHLPLWFLSLQHCLASSCPGKLEFV